MIDRLQTLHRLGYLYNDLKPENICVGNPNNGHPDSSNIMLIDFGITQRYVNYLNQHLPYMRGKCFEGNLKFASKNAFTYSQLSRRDDLISLCYMLVYFVNGHLNIFERPKVINKNESDGV